MSEGNAAKVMPWWKFIAIMLVLSLLGGLAVGLLREPLGLGGNAYVGVSASVGLVGAILIGRRRSAQAQKKK